MLTIGIFLTNKQSGETERTEAQMTPEAWKIASRGEERIVSETAECIIIMRVLRPELGPR